MAISWTNSDGLAVRFGATEGTVSVAGQYEDTIGGVNVTEVYITLTGLTATAGETILADNVMIPAGARIKAVEIINKTAATSGGSAVLNVGLVKQDRTTAIDADGLVAAQALTSHDTAGERTYLTPGVTAAGALIGTTLTDPGLLVADYDTAAYTAGVLIVRVEWFVPFA